MFSVTADAINVDSVGPESSYDNYIWTGSTQYSRAEFNEPFGTVYWYVRGPGETGFGTLVYTDYGDGTSENSQFKHTFNSGTTSGKEYEVTAYVYPLSDAADQSVDWDSYTLTVWTPPEEVITFPDTLTITDDIKIGDYYTFTAEASSTNSNYVIDEMEVFVDGVSVASQSFSAGAIISMSISGNVPTTTAALQIGVIIQTRGIVKKAGVAAGKWILRREFKGHLVGTVEGHCYCFDDMDELDNRRFAGYKCQVDSQWDYRHRRNRTRVKWSTTDHDGTRWTNDSGYYLFENEVPMGHDITMWLQGDDLHTHGGHKQICKYEEDVNVGKIGKVLLGTIPRGNRHKGYNFIESPVSTFDPCVDPYPVKFRNNW